MQVNLVLSVLLSFLPSLVPEKNLSQQPAQVFTGRMPYLSRLSSSHQGTEGNTKHWPQPLAWLHAFFNHHRTPILRQGRHSLTKTLFVPSTSKHHKYMSSANVLKSTMWAWHVTWRWVPQIGHSETIRQIAPTTVPVLPPAESLWVYRPPDMSRRVLAGPEMVPGQDFWPVTQPDPIRSLSIVKQILDNGLIAVSVRPTCQDTQTV